MTETDCMDCAKDCSDLIKQKAQLNPEHCLDKVKKSEPRPDMLYDSVR